MEKLLINGKCRLSGEVSISGAKNAAVAILPATLLVNGICTLENVPNISDINIYCEILESLGAKISRPSHNKVIVDTENIILKDAPLEMTGKFRASYYLIGALLGRCKRAVVGMPGGCQLGARPIDQHAKAFEALGATVNIGQGKIEAEAKKLVGTSIYLDIVSVGATINAILASVLAEGVTTIENVAKEPHIVDVANFLNTMGADIRGAGTDIIKVTGVKELSGGVYSIVPDQIEAGTFMLAAVATRGDIVLKNCITKHLYPLTAKIEEMGAYVDEISADSLRVWCDKRPKRVNIKTSPYPGFPSDLQSQIGVILSIAEGTSIINESIWESRFQYTAELNKMGANINAQGKVAVFEGVEELYGCSVSASDLRAGAALVIAGICANGETKISNIEYIDRGYENIEEKFRKLGAKIKRINE